MQEIRLNAIGKCYCSGATLQTAFPLSAQQGQPRALRADPSCPALKRTAEQQTPPSRGSARHSAAVLRKHLLSALQMQAVLRFLPAAAAFLSLRRTAAAGPDRGQEGQSELFPMTDKQTWIQGTEIFKINTFFGSQYEGSRNYSTVPHHSCHGQTLRLLTHRWAHTDTWAEKRPVAVWGRARGDSQQHVQSTCSPTALFALSWLRAHIQIKTFTSPHCDWALNAFKVASAIFSAGIKRSEQTFAFPERCP